MTIHPSAVIHPEAQIDSSVDIGPFCYIGGNVTLGTKNSLQSHVVIEGHTTLGTGNTIHPFVRLGGPPQDLKYGGEDSRLVIGDNNVIRECATLNIGTAQGGMETRLGSGCLVMAYAHIAHDCIVGNSVVIANGVGLAGHVRIDDHAILGGHAAIHQFCHIGRNAFVAGAAMVNQDIPPFCIAQGDRAALAGINIVGLRRHGWSRESITAVRHVFDDIFYANSGTRQERVTDMLKQHQLNSGTEESLELIRFIQQSERGVCPSAKKVKDCPQD